MIWPQFVVRCRLHCALVKARWVSCPALRLMARLLASISIWPPSQGSVIRRRQSRIGSAMGTCPCVWSVRRVWKAQPEIEK